MALGLASKTSEPTIATASVRTEDSQREIDIDVGPMVGRVAEPAPSRATSKAPLLPGKEIIQRRREKPRSEDGDAARDLSLSDEVGVASDQDNESGQVANPGYPRGSNVDLGLQGTALRMGMEQARRDASRPRVTIPSPVSSTGGLREHLSDTDVSLGLGYGGPSVAAARDAITSNDATGRARLEVEIDQSGLVRTVKVLRTSGRDNEWDLVALTMRKVLLHKKNRIPAGSRGLVLVLQVEAVMRLPSGGEGESSTKMRPQGLGIGGEFDVADIGAKPSRVVHARVVGQRVL